jgi:hypothetical protein
MGTPTTHVEQFDDSLGAFAGTGAIRFAAGLWLEEGTTNLVPNSGAESNTTGWAAQSATTLSRDATRAYVGSASFRCERNNGAGVVGMYSGNRDAGAGLPYTISARLTGIDALAVRLYLNFKDVGNSLLSSTASSPIATDSDWDPYRHTAISPASTVFVQPIIQSDTSSGTVGYGINIDAIQVEQKPYPTSLALSDMGVGYSAGAGGTHMRAASSASISPSGIFDTYLGAIVFVATPTIETGAEEIWGELGEKLAGADHIRWGRDSTKHPFVEWSGNDSAYTRVTLTATVDAGDEHFYSIEWHVGDADFRLYLDDDPSENDTIPSPQEDYGAGPLKLQATAGGVIYGGLAICSERLTNDQRARLKVVMENRGNIETALDSKRGRYGFFQVRPKVE